MKITIGSRLRARQDYNHDPKKSKLRRVILLIRILLLIIFIILIVILILLLRATGGHRYHNGQRARFVP